MKFSPKLIERTIGATSEKVYGQWLSVFNALQKNSADETALELLAQYNKHWSTHSDFVSIKTNDFGVPEYGMLKTLGYSVSFRYPKTQTDNINKKRRLALLKHIYANECPPLLNQRYKEAWARPASIERLDKIISVLSSLIKGKEAHYNRNAKAMERWKYDINELEKFKARTFPSKTPS